METWAEAYRAVDVSEEQLEEVSQSTQVQAGVHQRVRPLGLAPGHGFVQPELHLLGADRGLRRLGHTVRSDLERGEG